MHDIQNYLRLALISQRQSIINLTEAICSDEIKLKVAPDFSKIRFSEISLFLIDAFVFNDFDLVNLECGKNFSDFSICIITPDIPSQVVRYVEKNYKYILFFPVNTDYFRSYCLRTISNVSKSSKNGIPKDIDSPLVPDSFSGYFMGNSNIIKKVRSQILEASCSPAPVLILGETGVGKTTAARVIHMLSDRKHKVMVSVSLSTIVESLAESSFFGHRRGAFTNADFESCGFFEIANGSTLFLDELGVASLAIQAMFLTVLDTGKYMKIGDNKEQYTDVRMIFATNADLKEMLRSGAFLQALYFRICDNVIRIPPLREHKEDIRDMIMRYLGKEIAITEDAIVKLEEYSWPGNIRELHKCLKKASRQCHNKLITADIIDFGDINFLQ